MMQIAEMIARCCVLPTTRRCVSGIKAQANRSAPASRRIRTRVAEAPSPPTPTSWGYAIILRGRASARPCAVDADRAAARDRGSVRGRAAGSTTRAARAHTADADASAERDVHRLPRGDGGRVADAPVPRDVPATSEPRRRAVRRAGSCSLAGMLDDLVDVSPPAKLAGQVLAAEPAVRCFGVSMFFFRCRSTSVHTRHRRALAEPRAARHRAVGRGDGQRHQPDRRARRAGRRHRGDRGRGVLPLRRPAVLPGRLLAGDNIAPLVAIIAVGICVGFLPFNWSPGARSSWATRARCSSACCWPSRRSRSAAAPTPTFGQHLLLLRAPRRSR